MLDEIQTRTAREAREQVIQKIGRLVTLGALGAGLALGAAGCGNVRYEDCEVADQQAYEADCGYWEGVNGAYFLHDGLVIGARWHWWSWVVTGQNSFAPADWKPPHGLKPPRESAESKKRRTSHEKKIKQDQKRNQQNQVPRTSKNGNQPKTGSGNQGIPKGNNPVPRPKTGK